MSGGRVPCLLAMEIPVTGLSYTSTAAEIFANPNPQASAAIAIRSINRTGTLRPFKEDSSHSDTPVPNGNIGPNAIVPEHQRQRGAGAK